MRVTTPREGGGPDSSAAVEAVRFISPTAVSLPSQR